MENKVLAVINGKEIKTQDLEAMILRFPPERQTYLKTEQGKKQLLEELISFELVYNYAKDENLENDSEFVSQLEDIKKEVLTQYAIGKRLIQATVTDAEASSYYDVNKSKFMTKESVSAKHILVDTQEKAVEIGKKVEAGMKFEDAAKEYSSCPSSQQGGDLGTFTRGQMVPEFEDAAFSLPIGKVSEPVKTQFGYHLIKVEKRNEGIVSPFNDVKDSIKNQIIKERQSMLYGQFIEELNKKYTVVRK